MYQLLWQLVQTSSPVKVGPPLALVWKTWRLAVHHLPRLAQMGPPETAPIPRIDAEVPLVPLPILTIVAFDCFDDVEAFSRVPALMFQVIVVSWIVSVDGGSRNPPFPWEDKRQSTLLGDQAVDWPLWTWLLAVTGRDVVWVVVGIAWSVVEILMVLPPVSALSSVRSDLDAGSGRRGLLG